LALQERSGLEVRQNGNTVEDPALALIVYRGDRIGPQTNSVAHTASREARKIDALIADSVQLE
jgi:hypothetical protein